MDQMNLAAYRMTNGVVQRGPFKGMKLGTRFTWCSGEIANLLFGFYEQECHWHRFYHGRYDTIINVGCAEGYYAVGLALLNPKATVVAVDIGSLEREICIDNAELNGVAERVAVIESITPDYMDFMVDPHSRTLIVSDCEGYEWELMDPIKAPDLKYADFLVESHTRQVTEELPKRFEATHKVWLVKEGDCAIPHIRNLLSRDWVIAQTRGINQIRHWIFGESNEQRRTR